MVEGAGFEPAKPFRTPDLQSGGFNHSPTPPSMEILAYLPAPAQSRVEYLVPDLRYDGPLGMVPAGFDFK